MSNLIRSSAVQRALVVLLAAVATLAVWAVEAYVLGIDLRARPVPGVAPQVVGPPAIAFTTLLAGLVAWALLAILLRLTPSGRMVWIVVAVAALLVSLAGPIGGAISARAAVGLACMHLVAAAVLVPLLARSARQG
jgi:hypothetical protein